MDSEGSNVDPFEDDESYEAEQAEEIYEYQYNQ